MSYDLAFRFQQALDPSALMDIAASLHAIEAAITDCRNAGIATESDPAIILLCRKAEREILLHSDKNNHKRGAFLGKADPHCTML